MRVPFLDLEAAYRELRYEIDARCHEVLSRGWYVLGGEVSRFEEDYAAYVGARHCVGVGSGLDALELALRAMGVAPGDEVIVPSNTFIATWLAVMSSGARPVPVDPEERTYNLSANAIEAALTPRTRVIVPVHLYGQPADMDPILDLARHRGLGVLTDAAQAHGARYRGRPVGALGNACAWSFYPAKNLGAVGDGGAVSTDDAELADRVRLLRNYGSPAKHVFQVPGRNSRLDELQAAILRIKLMRLDAWNDRRRRVARRYMRALADTSLVLPLVAPWAEPSWHLFVVRSPLRDRIRQRLGSLGVQTQVHYPIPPYRQQACESLGLDPGAFPVAERLRGEVLSLPIGPHMSDSQLDFSIQTLAKVLTELRDSRDG